MPQPVMNFRWGNPDSFYDARTWNAVYFALMVNGDGKRFVREDLPSKACRTRRTPSRLREELLAGVRRYHVRGHGGRG